jgi:RNA polymerase sigma-70 factor (ECF subfamily)
MPLVERNDATAFEIVYDRHGGAAYSLAYRIVGDRGTAEDVTQEAFLSVWRSGARFDRTRGSVRTWLLGVVRNRAIDALRRQATRAPTVELELDRLPDRGPTAELTDTEALRHEAAREVRGALETLPVDQLKVIELAYFGGLTHSEIAQALGMPLGTVKGRMRLAMDKIRATLAEGVS